MLTRVLPSPDPFLPEQYDAELALGDYAEEQREQLRQAWLDLHAPKATFGQFRCR